MLKNKLLEQIRTNRYENNEQVIKLSDELLEHAKQTGDNNLAGVALFYKGEAVYFSNEHEAVSILKKCIELISEEEEPELSARAYNVLGIIYGHDEDYSEAINYYINSVRISLKNENYYVAGLSSANLGFLFQNINSYEMAISYYANAVDFLNLVEDNEKCKTYISTLEANEFVCYCLLDDKDKIKELIKGIRKNSDLLIPEFSVPMYEALYLNAFNDDEGVTNWLLKAVELALVEPDMGDYIDNFQILCRFLNDKKKYEEMKAVIDRLENNVSHAIFPRIRIELVKYKMTYYEFKNDVANYIAASKEYIQLYEKITTGYFKTINESLSLNIYVKELSDKENFYREKANTDNLTQLLNRTGLEKDAKTIIEHAKEEGKAVSTFIFDVDYFKQYNDCYGHVLGDECLKNVAQVMKQEWKEHYCAARYGGDEFVLLCFDMDLEEAKMCATKILEDVRALKIESKDSPISDFVSVSIGLSVKVPEKNEDLTDLIKLADQGLYLAKQQGRNQWCQNK